MTEISIEEFKKLKPKRLKYGNKKVIYKGIEFDSTKECDFYKELEIRKASGDIKDFLHQYKIPFIMNDKKVFTLILDFIILHNDNSRQYIDVKAFMQKDNKYLTTPLFQLKKKLIELQRGIKIELK